MTALDPTINDLIDPAPRASDGPRHEGASSRIVGRFRRRVDAMSVVVPDRAEPAGRVERAGVWSAAAATYVAAGWLLARHDLLAGDAMSRTLSAAQTVTGRDPHLESLGFVWPPFPGLFQVPLTLADRWIPFLVDHAFAAVIVSAVLMATMVATVRRWLEECGLGRAARLAVTALLALHPFVLLYGANGMSEASMLCFLVVGANRLARWWEREAPTDLTAVGVALAGAYLSRYEVALSIALVVVAVGVEAARRATGPRRDRLRRGLVAAVTVGFIPVSAASAWAGWSWMTIGEPFAQFTSRYGNSAIVAAAGVQSGPDRLGLFLAQAGLFGGAVVVLVAAVVWFGTHGLARVVATVSVVMAPLAFNLAAAWSGTTFAFARYTIALVPAAAMLAGPLLASFSPRGAHSRRAAVLVVVLAAAVFTGSGVVSLAVMWSGALGTGDEAAQLRVLPGPYRNDAATAAPRPVGAVRAIARDIDALGLPDDSILTDTFGSFLVVQSSSHRSQFVTTPDRDFERVLSAPRQFGIRFLLVPSAGHAAYDAVSDVWPGVFEGSNPIGRVAKEWGDPSDPSTHYRLVRLNAPGAPGS